MDVVDGLGSLADGPARAGGEGQSVIAAQLISSMAPWPPLPFHCGLSGVSSLF